MGLWGNTGGRVWRGAKKIGQRGDWKGGLTDMAKGYGSFLAGGGLLEEGYDWAYGDPAKQQKRGFQEAGKSAGDLGREQREFYLGGLDKSLGQYGTADARYNQLYGQGGELAGKGYLEQLYEQRQGGSDPYMDLMRRRGSEAIDQRSVAAGGYNSRRRDALQQEFEEGLQAQSFRQQADLAGAAERAKMGRLTSGMDYASGLARDKAGLTQGFYGMAGEAYGRGREQEIEARLAAAGVDAETRRQLINDLLGLGRGFATMKGAG